MICVGVEPPKTDMIPLIRNQAEVKGRLEFESELAVGREDDS